MVLIERLFDAYLTLCVTIIDSLDERYIDETFFTRDG